MSDALPGLVTVRCFWSPRCGHIEVGEMGPAPDAMERHYDAKHLDDVRAAIGWVS